MKLAKSVPLTTGIPGGLHIRVADKYRNVLRLTRLLGHNILGKIHLRVKIILSDKTICAYMRDNHRGA